MKTLIFILLFAVSGIAYSQCKDVGNVLSVRLSSGTTLIETSDGFFGFSKPLPVGKSNDRGRACYDIKRNTLCFPTSSGRLCEKVQ